MFRPSTVFYSILNAMKFENIHRDLLHEQSFWWKQNLKAIIYLLFCRVSRSVLHGNSKFNILSCLENNSKVSNSLISETKLTSWKLFSTQWLSKFSRFTQVRSIFRVSRSKSVTMSPPLSSQLSEVNFFRFGHERLKTSSSRLWIHSEAASGEANICYKVSSRANSTVNVLLRS